MEGSVYVRHGTSREDGSTRGYGHTASVLHASGIKCKVKAVHC